jgi:hypothetical protein
VARYLYERGEGRFKHCWNRPWAAFEPSPRGPVGKCSSKISQEIAQALLDDGIPFKDSEDDPHPSLIYTLFEGVPYEAAPTLAGRSFHGYPWRGRMPRRILRALEQRAKRDGFHKEFKEWLAQHSQMTL